MESKTTKTIHKWRTRTGVFTIRISRIEGPKVRYDAEYWGSGMLTSLLELFNTVAHALAAAKKGIDEEAR